MRNSRQLVGFALLAGAAGLYWWSRNKYGSKSLRLDYRSDESPVAPAAPSVVERAVEWVASMFSVRGLRNNNPGNIERGRAAWLGMAEDQSTDPRFIVFKSPEYGIRAIARLLRNYRASGFTTIRQIISRWAPPKENNTALYIAQAAAALGVSPDMTLGSDKLPALIEFIILKENGQQPYPPELIARGIELERSA